MQQYLTPKAYTQCCLFSLWRLIFKTCPRHRKVGWMNEYLLQHFLCFFSLRVCVCVFYTMPECSYFCLLTGKRNYSRKKQKLQQEHTFIHWILCNCSQPELMNAVPAFHLTLAASSLVLWLVFMSLSPFADKLCLRHHYVLLIYDSPQARCTWWMSINVKHTNKYNFYFLVKLFWLPRWCSGKKSAC